MDTDTDTEQPSKKKKKSNVATKEGESTSGTGNFRGSSEAAAPEHEITSENSNLSFSILSTRKQKIHKDLVAKLKIKPDYYTLIISGRGTQMEGGEDYVFHTRQQLAKYFGVDLSLLDLSRKLSNLCFVTLNFTLCAKDLVNLYGNVIAGTVPEAHKTREFGTPRLIDAIIGKFGENSKLEPLRPMRIILVGVGCTGRNGKMFGGASILGDSLAQIGFLVTEVTNVNTTLMNTTQKKWCKESFRPKNDPKKDIQLNEINLDIQKVFDYEVNGNNTRHYPTCIPSPSKIRRCYSESNDQMVYMSVATKNDIVAKEVLIKILVNNNWPVLRDTTEFCKRGAESSDFFEEGGEYYNDQRSKRIDDAFSVDDDDVEEIN